MDLACLVPHYARLLQNDALRVGRRGHRVPAEKKAQDRRSETK